MIKKFNMIDYYELLRFVEINKILKIDEFLLMNIF